MQFERVQDYRLELASCTLVHAERRSTTLIAMDHGVSPAFYRSIEQYINTLPGIVLSEGCTYDESRKQFLENDARMVVEAIWETSRRTIERCRELGLDIAYQRDTFSLPPQRTISSDLTLNEWVHELRKVNFDFSELEEKIKARHAHMKKYSPIPEWPGSLKLKHAIQTERRLLDIEPCEKSPMSENMAKFEQIIDDVRDELLLKNIWQCTRDFDVIVPWGSNHIVRMAALLQKHGEWKLEKESVQYFTAYECKHIPEDDE